MTKQTEWEVFPGASKGACANTPPSVAESFFAGDNAKDDWDAQRQTVYARHLCDDVCPAEVKWACLRHALLWPEEHGVWGGTTPIQRQRMRRNKVKMMQVLADRDED